MPSNIFIEELSYKYVDDIYSIGKLSLEEAWEKTSISKEVTNDMAKYFVAVHENKAIGFAGMWIIAGEADVTNIAVHPSYRKKGVGLLVTTALLDYCKNNSISSITLEVRASNMPAINLYKKLGFKEEGIRKGFYSDGEDALIMWNRDI